MDAKVVLSLKNITKRYPGVLALNNVSLDFIEGEVHALLGENGAGKSTLIKAVAGAITLDSGIIYIGEKDYQHMTPHLSRSMGVEVIYQEFNLVPTMSAAENIFLGDRVSEKRLVDYGMMRSKTVELFDLFKVDINPNTLVRELSPAQKQIVEIAKAVSKNVKILIMDEPSAPLSVSEVEHMFEIIKQLKQKDVTIIYISHRLEEVFRISDRVSVLRDGEYVATKLTRDTNRKELINLMIGRELKETYPPRANPPGEIALEVKNLTGNGDYDISFSVRKGEILGISGLVGAGRTELAMLLFGAAPIESGEIWVNGELVRMRSPRDAIQQRIGLLTEDRKGKGLFLEMGVGWNISFPIVRKLSKNGVVDTKTEKDITEQYKQRIDIKTPSMEQRVINLSGGNQQKVVLAKWLMTDVEILFLDEPTRGIDVGAKVEVYNLMAELARRGVAIVMISSELPELLAMCDRFVVLFDGSVAGEFSRDNVTEQAFMSAATGIA
jgi:ribose transport system ATP-binding protein